MWSHMIILVNDYCTIVVLLIIVSKEIANDNNLKGFLRRAAQNVVVLENIITIMHLLPSLLTPLLRPKLGSLGSFVSDTNANLEISYRKQTRPLIKNSCANRNANVYIDNAGESITQSC